MAATFVVEDGSGKSDANAYDTVEGVDLYWDNHGTPQNWGSASQAEKEQRIRLATQWLDINFGHEYRGKKAYYESALLFPRFGLYDSEGYCRDTSEYLPQELKDALAEVADRVDITSDLTPDITTPGNIKSETIKVGPITESKTYEPARSQEVSYPKIERILRPLLMSQGRLERA